MLPTESVGEVTKPSFDVFTLQSLKAKIEFPFYETYNFTVSAQLDWYKDYTFVIEKLDFRVGDKCLQASYDDVPQYLL